VGEEVDTGAGVRPAEDRVPLREAGDFREASGLFFEFFKLAPDPGDPLALRYLVSSFARIPYENLSKIVKSHHEGGVVPRFRLPPEVMRDHIDHRLGGTCFSLTYFLEKILRHAGYDCHKVMAHMHAGRNIHCAAVVHAPEGDFLIDPGYGLNRPIPLREDGPVRFASRHGGVEVVFDPAARTYHLYTYTAPERKWRYCFTNEAVPDDEFERYWIDSFARPSLNQICLHRASPQGHLYLRKNHLRLTTFRGQRKDNVRENLDRTVKEYFGISPLWLERAQEVLAERKAQRAGPGPSVRERR
jgi:arylamine N-acetyltransferase